MKIYLLIQGFMLFAMTGHAFQATQGHLLKSGESLDFSGINAFTALTQELSADRNPSEKLWADLEQTPGYAVLLQHEFAPDYFRHNFALALMPSHATDLDQELKNVQTRYLPYYVEISKQLGEIPSLIGRLNKSSAPQRAMLLASQWLPPLVSTTHPSVSVVVFGPEGRGYEPIVIDLFYSAKLQDDELALFLAHEFHHYFRKSFKIVKSTSVIDDVEQELLWALDQLQAEGIADQINVKPHLERAESLPEPLEKQRQQYRAWLNESPVRLPNFDALICDAAKRKQSSSELKRKIREILPSSGHPQGFFMADIILRTFGKKRLIANVGNPFAFVRDYNEAASHTKTEETFAPPVFSPDVIAYLNMLEQRIIK